MAGTVICLPVSTTKQIYLSNIFVSVFIKKNIIKKRISVDKFCSNPLRTAKNGFYLFLV